MAMLWRLILLSFGALLVDLTLMALPVPWPFPPFAFVAVLFVSLRQGEIPAMVQGFVLGLLFDILNMDSTGGTFLVLVVVGFSPWVLRQSRQLHKRVVQVLLCVVDVVLAYGIRLVLATSRPESLARMETYLNHSMLMAVLCAVLLLATFPLLEKVLWPMEEGGA